MSGGTGWRAVRAALSLAKNHGAFVLMVLSAGSLFVSNFMAKALLNDGEFVEWSYTLTLLTILTSYGLFGSENMIIRFGRFDAEGDRLIVTGDVWRAVGIILPSSAMIVFPVGISWAFAGSAFSYWQIAALTFLFGAMLVGGNVLRISRRFSLAQLMMNGWRLLAPLVVIFAVLMADASVTNIVLAALGFTLAGWGWFGRKAFPSLSLTRRAPDFLRVLVSFVFSLGVITAITNFDRMVVERLLGPEQFAEYVYLLMYLAFPFNLLSAYLGFREAVEFRARFSARLLARKSATAIGLATAIFALIAALVIWLGDRLMIQVSTSTLMMFLLLAVIRCGYAITSAAMAALGSARDIYLANTVSLAALLIAIAALFAKSASVSLDIGDILSVVIVVWFVRWVVYAIVTSRLRVAVAEVGGGV